MPENAIPQDLPIPEEVFKSFPPAAQALICALLEQVRALNGRVRDLEAKLNENSSNSSKPPSSDPPWAKPVRVKKRPSGRRRGGQPGHPPHQRQLFPPEAVSATYDHRPAACAHCQRVFVEGEDEDLEPVRHQIVDIPEVQPTIVEHRRHVRRCHACQGETVAALPVGVPLCRSGPRLQAWVGALTMRYRLSKREARDLLRELVGVVISLGGIADIEQYLSEALAPPVAEIQQAMQDADVVHHDETGWREANQKAWMWTTVNSTYAVYKIDLKRNGAVARRLVDSANFQGTAVTDRYKAYMCYPMEKRQICHAHLGRDYQKIADRPGPGQAIGEALCQAESNMFTAYHKFKEGSMDRDDLKVRLDPIQDTMKQLLLDGAACGDSKVEGMCNDILSHWPAMWTFASTPGVEPTNNLAEQAIRPFVLWRKGSFGTQSERGSRFMERMASVIQTCRRQGRHLLTFLAQAVSAWNHQEPAPSLIATDDG